MAVNDIWIGVITLREGSEYRALGKLEKSILEKGEACVIWSVKRNMYGDIIIDQYGNPTLDKKQFVVIGDGVTKFSDLVPYWPVRKESFNSIAAGKEGRARDIGGNFLATNGTARYNSLDEWVDAITHPFQEPYFVGLYAGELDPIEVGLTHDPNHEYYWQSSDDNSVEPGSVTIKQYYNGGETVLLSGLDGSGSFMGWDESSPARPAIIQMDSVGAQIYYVLEGISTSGIPMPNITQSIEAQALSTWFTWDDAQALIPTLTVKIGDPPVTYLNADDVKAICEDMLARGDGSSHPNVKLGNYNFDKVSIDGGADGTRLYALYPQVYRDSVDFLNNLGVKNAATRIMQLTLQRNGIDIIYNLMAMDLRVVGKLNITLR